MLCFHSRVERRTTVNMWDRDKKLSIILVMRDILVDHSHATFLGKPCNIQLVQVTRENDNGVGVLVCNDI